MKLNDDQKDALTESINIGVGRAAGSLGQLVGERIELAVPRIRTCTFTELSEYLGSQQEVLDTLVTQDFFGIANGRSLLGFSKASGVKLAQILGAGDGTLDELDLDYCSLLEEIGNIVLNAVLGSLANLMQTNLTYAVPELYTETPLEDVLTRRMPSVKNEQGLVLLADAHFGVARREIHGSLVIAFEMNDIETVLDSILSSEEVT